MLNGYFATPTGMYKQHASFFVNEFGGEFGLTFCPAPKPVSEQPRPMG